MGFEEDYSRYRAAVNRVCRSFLNNADDAEDAVQTTFLRWWQQLPRTAGWPEERKRAWLLVTAANCCRDELRSGWRRKRGEWRELPAGEELCGHPSAELLAALPPRYRRVLFWHDYLGYSTAEIARKLNCKPATVRSQLARARAKARRLWRRE